MIRVDLKRSKFFLLILFSPAFIFSWLIYSPGLDFQPYLVIFIYGLITQLSILSIFALPFFLYAVWCSDRPDSELKARRISAVTLLAMALFSVALKIQWGDFHIERYIQSPQFYAGFMPLLALSLTPLFFIRLNVLITLYLYILRVKYVIISSLKFVIISKILVYSSFIIIILYNNIIILL